jgi:NDP-sugar pyrophosphorylase family protein
VIASVILAAGPGSRLGELGARMPKAMIHVGGRPNLERLAAQHLDAGLRPVVVAVHHLAGMIRDYFGHETRWADVRFVLTGQRGTGADLLECLRHVTADSFVVCNGDTVVDLDLTSLLAFAVEDRDRGVIVLSRRAGVPNEGAFFVSGDGVVLASLEAVPRQPIPEMFAWRGSSTGMLVLRKSLLAEFCATAPLSLEATVVPTLVAGEHLRAFDNGTRYFLDFGTPDGLEQLNRDPIMRTG